MIVTDCHDMTLAVKVALNPNTTNQPSLKSYTLPTELRYSKGEAQVTPPPPRYLKPTFGANIVTQKFPEQNVSSEKKMYVTTNLHKKDF